MQACYIYRVLCSFNDITCKSLVVIILRNNNGFGHPFGLGIHVSGMGHCSKCISSSSTLHNPNDLAIARNSVSYGATLFFPSSSSSQFAHCMADSENALRSIVNMCSGLCSRIAAHCEYRVLFEPKCDLFITFSQI